MPYGKFELPKYPCERDMWDALREETRPIAVYGMGNGADKLFSRLEKYGVRVACVFASDGFVRGHFFRGYKVLSFSEVRAAYSDFVILLSFASNRAEVIDMLLEMDGKYDMYVPDMPVADAEEYFDREFYNSNYDAIARAYSLLCDEESRNCYAAVINYKLTGRMKYLLSAYSDKEELYSVIGTGVRRYMDVGAYNGDTLREGLEYFPNLRSALALEPDPKTYKRLVRFAGEARVTHPDVEIATVNAAAWIESGEGVFQGSANRNSSVASTASYEAKQGEVRLLAVDSAEYAPDFIKYDVEGAEYEALVGSRMTIQRYRPTLLVSVYHRSRDIFSLLIYLAGRYPFYDFKLLRLKCLPAWEIDLLALPKRRGIQNEENEKEYI